MIKQTIAQVAVLVHDYDEAINFYTTKLHFDLIEDSILSDSKRWVIISPKGSMGSRILLAKATNEEQKKAVGNQCGGRVFLFLNTNNFEGDYKNLIEQKVKIIREPVKEQWGMVAVFEDLYGNKWDLIESN
jgi:predicted enzyme related to lactoylglutathione lyase